MPPPRLGLRFASPHAQDTAGCRAFLRSALAAAARGGRLTGHTTPPSHRTRRSVDCLLVRPADAFVVLMVAMVAFWQDTFGVPRILCGR